TGGIRQTTGSARRRTAGSRSASSRGPRHNTVAQAKRFFNVAKPTYGGLPLVLGLDLRDSLLGEIGAGADGSSAGLLILRSGGRRGTGRPLARLGKSFLKTKTDAATRPSE